ncbi:hypothetical protein Tco_0610365 [Tanacetum coccineum]
MICVMNFTAVFDDVNVELQCNESCVKCFNLDAELLKSQNAYNDLSKSYSQLEKHCISLELTMQLNQENFQMDSLSNNQNALEIPEYFENNHLKAQLQAKDTTILKCSTSTCRSQHTCNKKNDRISQKPSSNRKNKAEAQPRKVEFKRNRVKETICDVNGSKDTNLYTIYLDDMLNTSLICLLSKASKTKSWTELITPDLICPSTYQLLRNSSGDSGPDLSFDKSASLERLFGLARASLVAVSFSFPLTFSIMAKKDMDLYHSRLTPDDLNDLIIKYKIPRDLHPRLPSEEFVMSELPDDAIGIYHRIFDFSGVRIPFSSFLLALIKHYRVHFSQLGPLGLNKVITFEVLCRSLQIEPTVTLFRVFQTLCKQGDWFSFAKRRAPSPVCIDDNRSCMKHWKSGFFLIDRRAIPDAMVWRHPDITIDDPRPATGSFNMADVRRLSAHVIKLRDTTKGVLVLSGLSRVWKNHFCDPVIWGADGNVMGQPFKGFPSLPATADVVIPNPTTEDLAAGTPSSKILAVRFIKSVNYVV